MRAFSEGASVAVPMDSVFENQSMIIPLETLKEQAVKHALKVTEGNILEAAKKLRISRSTMYEMIKKYDVRV